MSLNSGGTKSARILGRSGVRQQVTTGSNSSVGVVSRVAQRLTNVIFKHPAEVRPSEFGTEQLVMSPLSGAIAGGTAFTLRGDNFNGATGVQIGGVAATSFVLVNDETITGVTGAHAAGTVGITLVGGSAQSRTNGYTYV